MPPHADRVRPKPALPDRYEPISRSRGFFPCPTGGAADASAKVVWRSTAGKGPRKLRPPGDRNRSTNEGVITCPIRLSHSARTGSPHFAWPLWPTPVWRRSRAGTARPIVPRRRPSPSRCVGHAGDGIPPRRAQTGPGRGPWRRG